MFTSLWTPIVRTAIRSSLAAGWSGNRIYNTLHDWGLPKYHRETFLKVVRYEREFLRVGKATVESSGDVRFPHDLMVEEEFDYDSKYRLHGKATYYDEDLDEEFETDVQLYADSNLGKDGWEEQFVRKWSPTYEEEGIHIVSVRWEKIVHDSRYSY